MHCCADTKAHTLTVKALTVCLTYGSGWTWRQLTPSDFLTALPCCVGWTAAGEFIPHGVTHTAIQTRIVLEKTSEITLEHILRLTHCHNTK